MKRKVWSCILASLLTGALLLSGCGLQKATAPAEGQEAAAGQTTGAEKETASVGETPEASATEAGEPLAATIEELGLEEPVRPEAHQSDPVEAVKLHNHDPEPTDSTLPRIDIELPADYLLSKDEYTHGTIAISNAGEYDLPAADGKVRIRGNSTAQAAKKAFKVRFDEKQSVLGHDPEKTWTLLANVFDKTSIHNYVAMDLYDYLTPEGTFVPMCEFVEVYVNGDYQGIYNLCDQVETGTGRVDISGDLGEVPERCDYLVVDNFRANGDPSLTEGLDWFWMKWTNDAIEVKSPETKDGLTEAHTAYFKDYLDRTYEAIKLRNWTEIESRIDVDSFLAGLLLAELTNNTDIAQASMYMYKPAQGKLTFGPAWDFDMSFGTCATGAEGAVDYMGSQNNVFFGELMNVPQFREKYVAYFNDHYDDILEHVSAKIDETEAQYGDYLENEYQMWTSHFDLNIPEMNEFTTQAEQADYMKEWFAKRMEFLKNYYSE